MPARSLPPRGSCGLPPVHAFPPTSWPWWSCGVGGRCCPCGLRSPWALQGRSKVGRLLRVCLCVVVSLFGLWLAVGAAAASRPKGR
eukprot:5852573-Alexandrium_andersonii.AAC.1